MTSGRLRPLLFALALLPLPAAADEVQDMYKAVVQSCRRGRLGQAKAQVETMRRRFPGHAYTLKAELALIEAGRDYYDMVVNLKLFLRNNPDWPEADRILLRVASLYILHNNYSEALRTYATLLSNHPSSPFADEARIRTGNLLLSRGDLDAAEAAFRRLSSSSDARLRDLAALRMADILFYRRRWTEAAQAYDRLAASGTIEPELRLDALFQSGEAWIAAGRRSDAVERFRRVVDEFPETWTASLARQRLKMFAPADTAPLSRPKRESQPVASQVPRPYVQVGAFRDIREANRLRLRLKADGLEVTLRRKPEKDGYLYRVLAGPYASKAEAVGAVSAIRSQYGTDAFVVTETE